MDSAGSGNLDKLQPETLSGPNYPDASPSSINPISLSNPDDTLSGTYRGSQNVGSGPVIDSANNRILLTNPVDGSSVGIGTIPGSTTNEFGFFSLDNNGDLIMKIVNGTWYVYDLSTNKNIMQSGKLPDSSYGWAVAATNKNVSDGIS